MSSVSGWLASWWTPHNSNDENMAPLMPPPTSQESSTSSSDHTPPALSLPDSTSSSTPALRSPLLKPATAASGGLFASNRKSHNQLKHADRLAELRQQDRQFQRQASTAILASSSNTTMDASMAEYSKMVSQAHQQTAKAWQRWSGSHHQRFKASKAAAATPNKHVPPAGTPSTVLLQSRNLQRILNNAALSKASPKAHSVDLLALEKLSLERQKERARAQVALVHKRVFANKLPSDVQSEAQALFSKSGIISQMTGASVADKDLRRLKPSQWLNDELINFYIVMLNKRSNDHQKLVASGKAPPFKLGQEPANIFALTTFFYANYESKGYDSIKRWTKKAPDVFAKDAVLIPINLHNAHWVCACINFRKKRFEFYDSMGNWNQQVVDALRTWLVQEHEAKKNAPLDLSEWQDYEDPDMPQQSNAFDCGMFVAHVMEVCSRKDALFDFDQSNMPMLRLRMAHEIHKQKFMDSEWS